jgi:hypothetical protein
LEFLSLFIAGIVRQVCRLHRGLSHRMKNKRQRAGRPTNKLYIKIYSHEKKSYFTSLFHTFYLENMDFQASFRG